MRPTTAAAGAAALLLAAGLAACSGDPEPGSPLPTGEPAPSATGSAEPTGVSPSTAGDPSPSEQPVAAPTLPPEATTNDAAGAEAFVRYWYEALNYAYASGDAGPVMAASSDDCAICAELVAVVDEAYAGEGRLVGGQITLLDVASPAPDDRGITLVSVLLDQESLDQVDELGKTVRSEPASDGVSAGVVLERNNSNDGWLYYGAGQ